ncbi:Acylphosphatase [Lecanosticta acicola]|uniref:Acylphosphatase n=1 Tax=Lecanosticta acicola TaxID=111012 RepID=A0AAI9EAB0_9PEZI|nr:Acylphosphatase [Lecanosticta acicola]
MDKANGLKVTGFVRNSDDGSVVGEAQGPQDALDKFVQHLNTGPSAAEVHKVDQKDVSTRNDETKFNQNGDLKQRIKRKPRIQRPPIGRIRFVPSLKAATGLRLGPPDNTPYRLTPSFAFQRGGL